MLSVNTSHTHLNLLCREKHNFRECINVTSSLLNVKQLKLSISKPLKNYVNWLKLTKKIAKRKPLRSSSSEKVLKEEHSSSDN